MKDIPESNPKQEIERPLSQVPSVKGSETPSLDSLSSPNYFIQKDRFTCTFFMGKEVASIHFDRLRAEIFYNGHNIRNMNLTLSQVQSLRRAGEGLHFRRQNSDLSKAYEACINKVLNP